MTMFVVTGASGALGSAVITRLLARGHEVRAFQRRPPRTPRAELTYAYGDLGDREAVEQALAGADVVIHCGATMKGTWHEHRTGTVDGTRNVIAACRLHGVKQLVHISSLSVIDWAGLSERGPVDETAPLEPRPDLRGSYTRAKLEAELLVLEATQKDLPAVVLRPGQIFGGGIPLINGAVARNAAGRWLVLGDGKLLLPLVYIDDVVDAILAAVDRGLVGGEVIQIVDRANLDQLDVLGLAGGNQRIVRIPRSLVFAIGRLSELSLRLVGKQSPIGVYRLKSALARLRYESGVAKQLLGWEPRVGVRAGIARELGTATAASPAASGPTPFPVADRESCA